MDRQIFLDNIAGRLRELGVTDDEMRRPLNTFEQYMIDNADDELEQSLENPDEIDDLVQNLFLLIQKRRQRKMQTEKPTAVSPVTEPVQNNDDDGDMKIAAPQPNTPDENVREMPVQDKPAVQQLTAAVQETVINPESEDTYASGGMQNIAGDTSEDIGNTKTINAIKAELPPEKIQIPKRQKMTRAESKRESLHMYEDMRGISRPDIDFDEKIDPVALDEDEHIHASTAFWVIFLLTLPLTIPILAAAGLLFIAVFATLAVLIVSCITVLIADIIAGTALSLIGIIYGITQTFTVVPIGLYEIGLGIVIGGAAMLLGILIYNTAVRLLPYLSKLLYEFFCFCCKQLKKLFIHLKKESVKG